MRSGVTRSGAVRYKALGVLAAGALAVGACGGGPEGGEAEGGGGAGPTSTTSGVAAAPVEHTATTAAPKPVPVPPPPVAQIEAVALRARKVADIPMLTSIAWRPGDPDPYLADQHGEVFHLVEGRAEPALDLRDQVLDYRSGAESGMLGMTFDPVNGRLIVGYNGNDVDTRIESYAVGDNGRAERDSMWPILRIEQPGVGHNSGHLAFDADHNLFISMGDGGGSKGADAQDMTKLLGGLLRITPRRDGPGYDIPPDNPYVGQAGIAPEIWAKGMRQPWRFSIDRATGDIWVGGVGESTLESIYKIPAGQSGLNMGWPTYEGSHRVDFNTSVKEPAEWMAPVHEYPHEVGPAVIGGYVYHGQALPELQGAYVFMDMTGPVWAMGADGVTRLDIDMGGVQTSFGEDPEGELYMLTQHNGLFRLEPGQDTP